ncbi:heme biosynthesis HemY N-terminal domain-containing protein [Denitrificimonas caeni]|uniref:Heme biosynthesis protein HemY n=1 Tax=Denitrificimonas caeni TaxID=521720 RepID=A0AAE9VPT6_9GAMM|nr:heme biosynthesis HemY N-terminal domain-containing protein [Denitrificimonas caeni]WBE25307.1 heme biosynthesis protein HemY [Denitrificimonas caeni]
MKRTYLILLLVVAAAAALGMFIAEHTGYVLISWKSFRYESSLWLFLAVLAGLFAVLYGLRTLIKMLLVSTGLINPWSQRNQKRRVRLASEQGMLDLAQGQWKDALRHLRRAAQGESKPLVYLLGAANAAEKLGYSDEADQLLEQALIKQPAAEVAIALSHADLQLQRGDDAGAQDTLQAMHELHPEHPEVLLRLQALLRQRQEWSALIALLPALRKCKRLNSQQLQNIEYQAWSGRLADASHSDNSQDALHALKALDQAWHKLSSKLKLDPQLVAAYCTELLRLNAHEQAESLLRHTLKNNLNDDLIELYGRTQAQDGARQLKLAESWLKQEPQNPILLRALGRLSLRNQLWGKARDYFESSLRLKRQAHTCAELARLLSHLGDSQRSNQLFAESFQLLEQSLPALPQPLLQKDPA